MTFVANSPQRSFSEAFCASLHRPVTCCLRWPIRARPHFAAVGELVEKPIEPMLLLENAAALLKEAEAEARKTQAA